MGKRPRPVGLRPTTLPYGAGIGLCAPNRYSAASFCTAGTPRAFTTTLMASSTRSLA
jgi:hypothetical protein